MNDVKTKWEGLWKSRDAVYVSKTIKKADIPKYTRLIVRQSKYYTADSNKPRFIFCFAGGNELDAITLSKDEYKQLANRYCFTYEQLQELIDKIAYEIGGVTEYGEHIPSDFVDTDATGLETEIY